MFNKMKMKFRVRKGAKLLDEKKPGWADEINPDRLDLSSGLMCIVGQTFGEFSRGVADLGVEDNDYKYGFDTDPLDEDDSYADLDEAWLKQINKRSKSAS